MKVRFYTLKKKVNSTKTPSGVDTYTEYDCRFKESTSEHDPILEINAGINTAFNWAYIPDWNRCYFVRDAVSVANGLTQYYLTEDVLATYRAEIINSKQYVAFASTKKPLSGDPEPWDKYKVDPRVAVSTTKVVTNSTANISILNTTGCYILFVFNNLDSVNNDGFASAYALDAANMGKVRNWLGTPTIMTDIISYLGGSPLESIFGCIWIPIAYSSIGNSESLAVSFINIGNHNSNVDGFTISGKLLRGFQTLSTSFAINITGLRDDFRRSEPYTSASLYLPGAGMIDFNLSDWITSTQIQGTAIFELNTGNMLYILRDANGPIIQTVSCSMAAQCPLGQMNVNTGGVVNSIGGFIGGAAALMTGGAGVAAAGAIAMLASGASAVLNANKRAPSISGSVGGRVSSTVTSAQLTIYEVQTEDPGDSDYVALKGRPVGKVMAMDKVYGYVQCDGASVPIAGTAQEIEEVNNFLDNGFFIETILP